MWEGLSDRSFTGENSTFEDIDRSKDIHENDKKALHKTIQQNMNDLLNIVIKELWFFDWLQLHGETI